MKLKNLTAVLMAAIMTIGVVGCGSTAPTQTPASDTGTQTEVGFSANTFEIMPIEGTDLRNYDITKVEGTLTVRRNNPTPSDDPDDPTDPTPIDDEPTPTAPAPVDAADDGVVLGARREEAAVLGARRAKTDDTTNQPARVIAIIIAAAVAVALLTSGRKKEEEEEQ